MIIALTVTGSKGASMRLPSYSRNVSCKDAFGEVNGKGLYSNVCSSTMGVWS
jgi:hypothetical protein